jgi:phospholipase/lecithinase/hemolysin
MSIAAVRRSVSSARAVRRLGAVALAAALAVGLSACGGGDQVNKFTPGKIVSFGDEMSYIGSQSVSNGSGTSPLMGQKYGVNYVAKSIGYYNGATQITDSAGLAAVADDTYGSATYALDSTVSSQLFSITETSADTANTTRLKTTLWSCATSARLWNQILAASYSLGFKNQCPTDATGANTYAAVGAKVADVLAQFDAHRSELDSTTLVTVWVGQNDVLEMLAAYKTTPSNLEAYKTELKARGERLGQAINGLLATGARVLLVSVPDLSKAPGASGYTTVANELSQAFNSGLIGLNGVTNDGTRIGLVKAYDLIKDIVENPTNYGSINVTAAMCDASALKKPDGSASTSLLDCVYDASGLGSSTISGATLDTHLWASDYILSPLGQAKIGALAYTRLANNPF